MRKMKESGVPWIGEIPEGWSTRKLKYIGESIIGITYSPEEVSDEGILVLRSSNIQSGKMSFEDNVYVVKTISEKMIVHHGDILICSRNGSRELIGKCALIDKDSDGSTFGAFMTLFRSKANRYIYYIFNSPIFSFNIGTFLTTTVNQLTISNLGNITAPIPQSEEEQRHIADYLDSKTTEIDSIIKAKDTINKKLKEYRQSVIYEAVTKGLDKNAKLKDSGVEWIGEIPEGWQLSKLKYDSYMKGRIGWQGLKAEEFIEEGPYLVTGTDFENGKVIWERCYHITEERFEEAPDIHLNNGDLLITKDGTIGKLAYIDSMPDKASLNSHLLVIRPITKKFINRFLYYVFSSSVFEEYIQYAQNGTIMDSLSQEKIGNFIFACPDIEEQGKIVINLDCKCAEIDSVITANEKNITKLKEYRQSIIYEAVTGKVEV